MYKIAIIEDKVDVADNLGKNIDRMDDLKLVGTYYDAESALEVAASVQPDIYLTDIVLPAMNGIECMYHLKNSCPKAMFLMFTAWDNDDNLFNALRFGADGYILKEDGIMGAIKAIRTLIAGGAPMSHAIGKKVFDSMREKKQGNPQLKNLTDRQLEVLKLVADGLQNKEIADRLNITEGSVKQHIHGIYKALEVSNRVEAANLFRKN